MDSQNRLEKLKEENKIKIAKKQLINNLNNYYGIDIANATFAEYHLSKRIHSLVYKLLDEDNIKTDKFYYDESVIDEKLEHLFNIYRQFENDKVLIFPEAFRFNFHTSHQLYLIYPTAIVSTIKEFRGNIIKLIHDIQDNLIVVEENAKYEFVIWFDDDQYINIEFWGI